MIMFLDELGVSCVEFCTQKAGFCRLNKTRELKKNIQFLILYQPNYSFCVK